MPKLQFPSFTFVRSGYLELKSQPDRAFTRLLYHGRVPSQEDGADFLYFKRLVERLIVINEILLFVFNLLQL